ncbi:MAG: amidohydrolase family protein [Gemmatimonadales bacterium]
MSWTTPWKRYAVTSLVLVLIPLPLTLVMRAGIYGLAGATAAILGCGGFAVLYWWPLGALHLSLQGSRWARWSIAYLVSIPLFFLALWVAYWGIGSRLAPAGAGSWGIYLENTPWWFLATLGLAAIVRRDGIAGRIVRWAGGILLIGGAVAVSAFVILQDQYRWPHPGPGRFRIVNARIVDPVSGTVLEGQHVWIDHARITNVIPAEADTSTASVLDAGGRYLMPGLIDAHLHLQVPVEGGTLAFHPGLFFGSLVTSYAPHRRSLLEAGVTTIRDLGGAAAVSQRLRDAINGHRLLGPHMVTVARLVTSPGGHPVGTIWPRELSRTGAIQASDSTAMIAALTTDLRAFHPDGLKLIYGTIGRAPTRLDPRLLRIAADWGRANGLWVAVHAETEEEVMTAVLAGATTVEHVGSMESLPGSLIQAIKTRKPWLDATLGEWLKAMQLGKRDSADVRRGLEQRFRQLRRLRDAGARFIVGTDAPLVPYGAGLHDELALLQRAGFTTRELIRMVTVNNAEALGLGGDLGRIAAGCRADLILVDGNPFDDIRALRRPAVVIRDGEVVQERR